MKYFPTELRIMNVKEESRYIARILKGDADAYRPLVDRYQAGLIIHCENILKDRADAEDIAQDAFIKAYKSLEKFSADKAQFSTWLYRIATNLCIDFLRRHKRVVHIKNIEEKLATIDPAHIEREQREAIQKVIAELEPPKYAAIITAYFWEGQSYQQIALTYQTTTNTVGTWMRRAKLQLKEKLS